MENEHNNKSTPIITPLVTKPELSGYGERTSWLIQPLEVSMMYQEFGLSQIRAMLTVIRQMQEPINNVINGADPHGQLEIFKQNDFGFDNTLVEDGVVIELKMKDLTNDHSQYKAIREVIKKMQSLNVSYVYKNSDGRDIRVVEPFIRKFLIPEGKQRIHAMHVVLSPQIAEMIISMDGYSWHRILENVILESSNTATQRLYLYISAMRTKTKKREFDVATEELRRQSGTNKMKFDNDTGKILEETVGYKQWGMYAKNVLDVAKNELKEKFDQQKCDFYFEWSPIYNMGRAKKGEPDFVHFLTFSFDDKMLGVAEYPQLNFDSVQHIVVDKFGIRINNFGYFKKLITTKEILDKFYGELERIDQEVKGEKRNSKYFYTCCKSAIDHIIAETQEQILPKEDVTATSQPSQSLNEPEDKCKQFIEALKIAFGNGQMGYDYLFGRKTYCAIGEEQQIVLFVPSFGFEKIKLSNIEREKIDSCIRKVFGNKVEFDIKELK